MTPGYCRTTSWTNWRCHYRTPKPDSTCQMYRKPTTDIDIGVVEENRLLTLRDLQSTPQLGGCEPGAITNHALGELLRIVLLLAHLGTDIVTYSVDKKWKLHPLIPEEERKLHCPWIRKIESAQLLLPHAMSSHAPFLVYAFDWWSQSHMIVP